MTPDILQTRSGTIAQVTLFNPDKLNAINAAMWRRLRVVMETLSADDSLRAVVIRGEGGHFAAGGDLEEMEAERSTRQRAQRFHGETVAPALAAVAECQHPVVAAIQGACAGGGLEIAAACDLRIAGTSARFGAPIMKLGFSMYPGELAGLLEVCGAATALEILLEGRLLTAAEALQKGLVTRVVADEAVAEEALATAQRIAAGAPLVARAHKRMIRAMNRRVTSADLRIELPTDDPFWFLDTADHAEGMAAFREKRAPVFTGR
ncbi:MAG: enoyl-CoA hydratase/isomerase family protein [Rhodocyclaceae bacterium]|nr:enoyl-CoA hydratase/isomerase family protein [Rhodocyclaceae bacterium]